MRQGHGTETGIVTDRHCSACGRSVGRSISSVGFGNAYFVECMEMNGCDEKFIFPYFLARCLWLFTTHKSFANHPCRHLAFHKHFCPILPHQLTEWERMRPAPWLWYGRYGYGFPFPQHCSSTSFGQFCSLLRRCSGRCTLPTWQVAGKRFLKIVLLPTNASGSVKMSHN